MSKTNGLINDYPYLQWKASLFTEPGWRLLERQQGLTWHILRDSVRGWLKPCPPGSAMEQSYLFLSYWVSVLAMDRFPPDHKLCLVILAVTTLGI